MKICMISPNYPPNIFSGGVGDYTRKLCEEIAVSGHGITLLVSTGYKGEDGIKEGSIEVIPFASNWGLKAFLKLFGLCRKEKYDAVDLQYSPPLYGFLFRMLYPFIGFICPAVVTVHTLVGAGLINRILALMLVTFSSEIISTNEEVTYLIKKYMPWKKDLVQIPIGSNILPAEGNRSTTQKEKGRIVLTHFGLYYPGKGIETILKAVAELGKEYDDFEVIMLGGKWPGREGYYKRLKEKAQELGVDEKVRWLGYLPREEVSKYLSMTDIFLISFDKGISIRRGSYIAALAHGLPIISTYSRLKSKYIKDNDNIVLVPPGDHMALKEKILELIRDPDRRRKLGQSAKDLMKEFSWPSLASRTIEALERSK